MQTEERSFLKVSVIIPCYNGEKFIDTSIRSVYEQDYPDIELIVVDDGSTDAGRDKILAWVDRFREKGFSLQYVYQENLGPAGAVNTALKYVGGEYLTLLDADDYFLPGSVAKRAVFLDNHPDFAGVRTNGWMLKGDQKTPFIRSEKEKNSTDYFNALFFDGAVNWAGSYMVRAKLLFDFYPDREIYPSRFGQNMQIILPVAYKKKFGIIDEPLMVYVVHENSLTQSGAGEKEQEKTDRNFYGFIDIYRHMTEEIIHSEEEKKIYLNIIDSWIFRRKFEKAAAEKDLDSLKRYFRALEETGCATLNDKIRYYSFVNRAREMFYRLVRRFTS